MLWHLTFYLYPFLSCRVFCVKFSCDATYVISGSDDTNLRLWKAKASEQLGVVRNPPFSINFRMHNSQNFGFDFITKSGINIFIFVCETRKIVWSSLFCATILFKTMEYSLSKSEPFFETLQLLPREQKRHEYHEAVKNRYKHLPEVKRIVRHRHLPKPIFKAGALRRTMREAERRKKEHIKAHSAPGSIAEKPLRKQRIVKVED